MSIVRQKIFFILILAAFVCGIFFAGYEEFNNPEYLSERDYFNRYILEGFDYAGI